MKNSPWGAVQGSRKLGLGLVVVWTAGHGGIYVPPDQLFRVKPEWQAYAERWSGSKLWFEEDCASALVILSFPELFDDAARVGAVRTLDWLVKERCLAGGAGDLAEVTAGGAS